MKHIHISRKQFIKYLSLAAFIFVLANCTSTIDNITQPLTAKVNDVINVKLSTTWNSPIPETVTEGRQVVLGILAPKGWKLGQSGNAAIEVSSYKGKSKMSPIPLSTAAAGAVNGENWPTLFRNKFGIGPNYIDDMEWVAFKSDVKMLSNGGDNITGTFDMNIKVGSDNRNASVRLGYVICTEDDGLAVNNLGGQTNYWDVRYADCMSITGGQGDVIDFCNPAFTYLTPAKVLDNEYVTILFDGTVAQTKLTGADNVYLCATAHTTDNQDIVVCSQDDKTKMVKVADNKYNITFWPKGYFNVPQGKTLASIDYYITDKTGAIKVGYANTSTPFKLTFACE